MRGLWAQVPAEECRETDGMFARVDLETISLVENSSSHFESENLRKFGKTF